MNEYSMPRYFQNMEKIGDAAFAYDAENEKVLKDAEAEIARRIEEVLESGKTTEALNESGQLSAMQRISKLVDEGTWRPLNSLLTPRTMPTALPI